MSIKKVTGIFENKSDAYSALLKELVDAGGYIVIDSNKRPSFHISEEDIDTDVKIRSLVNSADNSSPLKFIAENDEMYDVYDYLGFDEITRLYLIVKGLK